MKLTTKLGLIFLAVVIVMGGGLGLFGIPSIKRYLETREVDYYKSFLKREMLNTRMELVKLRTRMKSETFSEEERDDSITAVFDKTSSIFDKFFAHETARFFVIDN